ncbi:MAG: DNA mismatch repair protein MutS [Bacteroidota bacterium]
MLKYRPAKHGNKVGESDTPLMQQYNSIKGKYPDAILLFRIGDFYETFGEDAIRTASVLGITLTKRRNGAAADVELAGFPYHALDTYLPKLVRAGHRVAICDQLEDPKFAKKIVKRGITELITPGVTFNDKVLDHKTNNFLAAIHFIPLISSPQKEKEENTGVSFLDVSTGEFLIAQGTIEYIEKLLQNFKPSEILFQKNKKKQFTEFFGEKFYTYGLDDWVFTEEFSNELLLKHFCTTSLKGFGIENLNLGIVAAGAALHYLAATQHDHIQHITNISRIEEEHFVWLDKFTTRNLELFWSPNEKAKTLIDILDQTISPMGSRLMKRWLILPLKEKLLIDERLDIVSFFLKNSELQKKISQQICLIGDLERLISKVATGKISPREVIHLKKSLLAIEQICGMHCEGIQKIREQLNPCRLIRERIEKEIMPDPPLMLGRGKVITDGVNVELDELRKIMSSGKNYLLEIQQREVQRTNISSLKIGFNNIFGYYLEVTNTHKNKVPADWIRKQTVSNAERYITEELKQYEEKILGAEEKILALETKLFNDMVLSLTDYIPPIQLNASLIARLDCLLSFTKIAYTNNYVRPQINETKIIDIKAGRHPVIEKQLPVGEEYIANDIYLDPEHQQILIITGPNMSGKSALLRQTALITIMAQMGSFVPAQHADIGIVDKIFTRVGASDNLSLGESTFMVEMNETASILNNLSDRCLILLDEIGRGTSTYDGISIAWAITEFLHNHPSRAKVLFATHYHELNEMEKTILQGRIKNFHVSIKEIGNKVLFIRKLVPGGTEHSFGIHVAKMAGIPKKVVDRANEILEKLEIRNRKSEETIKQPPTNDFQLSFFQLNDPVLEQIKDEILSTDINTLTPIEALMKLNEIKKIIG